LGWPRHCTDETFPTENCCRPKHNYTKDAENLEEILEFSSASISRRKTLPCAYTDGEAVQQTVEYIMLVSFHGNARTGVNWKHQYVREWYFNNDSIKGSLNQSRRHAGALLGSDPPNLI